MQSMELPSLQVASFVTSDGATEGEDTSFAFCTLFDCATAASACCSDLDCTETVCSTSDQNGGNSCTDECHPGSSGC